MNDYILEVPDYEPDLDREADEYNDLCLSGAITADMMDAARPGEGES